MLKIAGNTHAYTQQSLETALREISRLGLKGVDIWATPNMGEHLMPGKHDPKAVKALLDDLGLEACAVSGFGGDRDLLKGRMELAAAIATRTFVLGIPSGDDWLDQVESTLNMAKSLGLELAFENHKFSNLETEQQIKDLLERFPDPDLGIALAPTHYYTCGFNPHEGIRVCGDRLKYMYLWDVKKDIVQGSKAPHHQDPRTQVPGGGKLDFEAIARTLDEISYAGWCGIFWHGSQDWPVAETTQLFMQGIKFVEESWDKAGIVR